MERKIHNFKSIILDDMTFEKYGYKPSSLGNSSAKFVCAVCRFCGQPSDIRKGFFNKSGSACHKQCRFAEQSLSGSPFKNEEVREKSKITNLARYGNEIASASEEIKQKISKTKLTEYSQQKSKNTVQEKYGVDNPFQSSEVKDKIKSHHIEKYGFEHHMQSPILKEQALTAFQETVIENENGTYNLINIMRSDEFWTLLADKTYNLHKIAEHFGVKYKSILGRIQQPEFCERYYNTYHFPTQQQQNDLANEIRKIGIDFEQNTRQIITPLELDIYIPEKSFAIEFNGSIWHSEAKLDPKDARMKHRHKLNLCREKGIRLFNLFEGHWKERREQILSFIRSALGKNEQRIMGRETTIGYDGGIPLLNNTHIQGQPMGFVKTFDLLHNGEVVGTMTAGKHHRQNVKGNPIVLTRLCFKNNVTVQGGASKLFKHFVEWAKNEKYDRILSWSDSMWTDGGIYKTLGFNLTVEYHPDYFYWNLKKDQYVSKQSQRKSNTGCPQEIKERDWAFQRGLYRIWDCGKKLWTYKL